MTFSQNQLIAIATYLEKSENEIRVYHLHSKHFHVVKRYKNRSSISWDIRLNMPDFAMSYKKSTNEPRFLWSYWTKVHEIFIRYRGIIYAVNAHIQVVISHSVSECQSDKSGEIAIFHKIGCHCNVPWDIGKRGPARSSAPKTLSFGENIAKIGPADPMIVVLREINKKEKKKEITEGKIYSPVDKFSELAKEAATACTAVGLLMDR